MGHYGGYTESDFMRLLDKLSNVEGKFILSSYPSDILADSGSRNNRLTMNIDMTRSAGGGQKTEVLTMNYNSRNQYSQLELF